MMLSYFKSFVLLGMFKSIVFFSVPILSQINIGTNTNMFMAAIKGGHVEYVRAAVEAGMPVDAKIGGLTNPLNEAARYNHPEIVELFIRKGADVKATDGLGQTVVHAAVETHAVDVLRVLYKLKIELDIEFDIDARDNIGETALYKASGQKESRRETFRLLFLLGADPDIKNGSAEDFTALYAAVDIENPMAIEELIRGGANTEIENGPGRLKVLGIAALEGKLISAKALLDGGADPNAKNGKLGLTALHLVAVGAPHNQDDWINSEDLVTALFELDRKVGDIKEENEEARKQVAKLLIDAKADIDFQATRDEVSPTHLAVMFPVSLGVLNLFIDSNANLDVRDVDGFRAIYYAGKFKSLQAIKLLRKGGAKGSWSALYRYWCSY